MASSPSVTPALLGWWESNGRDLPWRHTRDPWLVLVSEAMAQQTQVERVIPSWRRFVSRFPTPTAAAKSDVGEIVRYWDGLGYNRRAVHLHEAAVVIADRFGGRVPAELDDLLALPGVGPYTARAVQCFAFEQDVGVVDTNVGRVLARLAGRRLAPAAAQAGADALVPPGRSWAWNQALLDFGATVCTKRSPACGDCPVRAQCGWAGRGEDPAVGSAGVSVAQPRFEGSDRQGRGRLVSALRSGPVDRDRLALVMGWPTDPGRAARVASTLVTDGLAVVDCEGRYRLP